MAGHQSHNPADYNLEQRFTLDKSAKNYIFSFLGIGLVLLVLGIIFAAMGEEKLQNGGGDAHGGHHSQIIVTQPPLLATANKEEVKTDASTPKADEAHGAETHAAEGSHDAAADHGEPSGEHGAAAAHGSHGGHDSHGGHGHEIVKPSNGPIWLTRLFANLLANAFFFTAISALATFFIAVKYASNAGWFIQLKRIAEAMGFFVIPGAVILMIIFFASGQMLYDWKDGSISGDPFNLTAHKKPYLDTVFFIIRNLAFFAIWIFFYLQIRKSSLDEDNGNGGLSFMNNRIKLSAIFIFLFALSFSAASWDWIMSLEVTWFSTMFGVYVFASCWVSCLAIMTLFLMFLKEKGLMPYINTSHFHDLARMVFGFSIFWTYIWFCQFLLIWYANIPEETTYFRNRMEEYPVMFFGTFIMNFILPFFILMSRANNRHLPTLGFTCVIVILGHWLDLSIMVFPGPLKSFGDVGLMEVGTFLTFLGLFCYVTAITLAKANLLPKKHPLLMESIDHHFTS